MTRFSPAPLLLGVLVVIGALVVVDLQSPSTATSSPEPVRAGSAIGGAWFCAAGAVGEDDELSVLSAAPESSDAPSDTEVTAFDGARTQMADQRVFPGSARSVDVTEAVDAAVGTELRWWESPAVASRVWRRDAPDAVSGTVSGPCAQSPSPTWYVPGMSTADGGQARLYLANAFASDASVSITFTTPTGPEEPLVLENVSVPSHSVEVVDLNEYVPRQADLGVAVTTRAGRVVAEGVQVLDPAVGGVRARSLVPAAPQLAEVWTMPWTLTSPTEATEETPEEPPAPSAPTGERVVSTSAPEGGTAGWIWVSNPGEEAAAVTLTLHTASGAVVPDIGDELLVDPGRTRRIDLRGLLPAGRSATGATLRSENGVPVVAGASSLLAPEAGDPDQTGFVTGVGTPEADTQWVVPGEGAGQRTQVLHLVNPGAEDAVVDVALWNGSVLRRLDDLEGVTVPAGALVELDVTDVVAGGAHMVAHVTATEGAVVAGRHSVGSGRAAWIAHTGVPSRTWSGGQVVPSVDHAPHLLERFGTSGGLQDIQPGEPAPSPTPTPTTPLPTPTSTSTSPPGTPTPTTTGSPTDEG